MLLNSTFSTQYGIVVTETHERWGHDFQKAGFCSVAVASFK